MELALYTHNFLTQVVSAINLSRSYFNRHNPLQQFSVAVVTGIKNALTMNKKLKIAKYRVNNLQFQMNKMDKMINDSNPYNFISGGQLNTFN